MSDVIDKQVSLAAASFLDCGAQVLVLPGKQTNPWACGKEPILPGQVMVAMDYPEWGQSTWGNRSYGNLPDLLENAEDDLLQGSENGTFVICSRRQADALIERTARVAGMSTRFFRKFVVIMTYDQVVKAKEGEIIFEANYHQTWSVEARTDSSQWRHVQRLRGARGLL